MSNGLVRQVGSVSIWTQSRYRIKRAFWSFFERTFRVFTMDGQLVMLVKHPLMRFREEFIVYADEHKEKPLLHVKAKQLIAVNFAYEITDMTSGEILGIVQSRGLRSLVRDRFVVFDRDGNQIGMMEEEGNSLLRRFFPFLTSRHTLVIRDEHVAHVQQIFRFITKEFEVQLSPARVDPRFVLACALLALMAEARREDR
jgi:hypothetical protein